MLKIYTPQAWYATLGNYPSVIIEDDGLIYSEEDYYKTFRNPVGKLDAGKGFIYGPDYMKNFAQPIGAIKNRGSVTAIYGPDYVQSFAQPILYIRDNRIYPAEEFFKLFPQEAGFIKDEGGKESTQKGTPVITPCIENNSGGSSSGSSSGDSAPEVGSCLESAIHFIKVAAIILVVVVLMFFMMKMIFVDNLTEDSEMAQMAWGSLAVGVLVAICAIPLDFLNAAKKKKRPGLHLIRWSMVGSVVTLMIWDNMDVLSGGVKPGVGRILLTIASPLIYGVTMIIPCAIIGTLLIAAAEKIWNITYGNRLKLRIGREKKERKKKEK